MPIFKELVLIGGGHSHVAVLKRFGMKPMPGVCLKLICRDLNTLYSGMLPGLIAGHYTVSETHIDLVALARFAGAQLVHDSAVGIDLVNQWVLCRNRPPVRYDLLSIDIGSTPRMADIPGAVGRVVPVKPIDQFIAHWEKLCERALARRGPTCISVVGGGAGGVEILLASQYRLKQLLATQGRETHRLEFHLLTDSSEILPTHNSRVRAKFQRVLNERGVQVYTNHKAIQVEPGRLRCENGVQLAFDEILWVTRAGAADWLARTGLALDEGGFIQVNPYLQSTSHANVFAAGDVASMVDHPRPKAGVFAVRQGPALAANLRRALGNQPLRSFAPQKEFLSLISTGDRYAIASRSRWAVEGRWVWRWKDWIDRRFMRQYRELPARCGV